MTRMNPDFVPEFEQFVRDVMESCDAVGTAVSMFGTDETYYEKFFGRRDAENGLEITPDTLFGLASLTKSFTCVALMQLVEKGAVDLDGPVSDYIPEFTGKNQPGVRVRHLLSHSAGFFPEKRILAKDVALEIGAFDPEGEDLAYSDALAAEGVRRVAGRLDGRTRLIGRPGELMSYSNDSFGLISDIVRRRGGEPSYARYVARSILEPLGMTRSTLEFERATRDGNRTRLYIHRDGVRVEGDFYDNAFVLMGGGAMRSTVGDMKKYVRMFLNEGTGENGAEILTPYSVREMRKPVQFYRHRQYYGCGLATRFMDDITAVGHGGGLTGVSSAMLFSPELEAGVLVLCNTTDVPVSEIADAGLRLLNGRKPVREPDFADTGWTQETLRAACGFYRSGEGTLFEIHDREGRPGLRLDGKEQTVRTVGREMLIVVSPHTTSDLILCRNPDGNVWGVRYGGRIVPKGERWE